MRQTNSYSDNPELDFLDEEPTDPFIQVTAQLNSAVSIVDSFSAQGTLLGYLSDPPKHWMERLELEEMQIDESDIIPLELQ
jgi:hypothetical protein